MILTEVVTVNEHNTNDRLTTDTRNITNLRSCNTSLGINNLSNDGVTSECISFLRNDTLAVTIAGSPLTIGIDQSSVCALRILVLVAVPVNECILEAETELLELLLCQRHVAAEHGAEAISVSLNEVVEVDTLLIIVNELVSSSTVDSLLYRTIEVVTLNHVVIHSAPRGSEVQLRSVVSQSKQLDERRSDSSIVRSNRTGLTIHLTSNLKSSERHLE